MVKKIKLNLKNIILGIAVILILFILITIVFIQYRHKQLFINPILEVYETRSGDLILANKNDLPEPKFLSEFMEGGALSRYYYSIYETNDKNIIGYDLFAYNGLTNIYPLSLILKSNIRLNSDVQVGYINCNEIHLETDKCLELAELLIKNNLSPNLGIEESSIREGTILDHPDILGESLKLFGYNDESIVVLTKNSIDSFEHQTEIIKIDLTNLKVTNRLKLEEGRQMVRFSNSVYISDKSLYSLDLNSLSLNKLFDYPENLINENTPAPPFAHAYNSPRLNVIKGKLIVTFLFNSTWAFSSTPITWNDAKLLMQIPYNGVDYLEVREAYNKILVLTASSVDVFDESLLNIKSISLENYSSDIDDKSFALDLSPNAEGPIIHIFFYRDGKGLRVNLETGDVSEINYSE